MCTRFHIPAVVAGGGRRLRCHNHIPYPLASAHFSRLYLRAGVLLGSRFFPRPATPARESGTCRLTRSRGLGGIRAGSPAPPPAAPPPRPQPPRPVSDFKDGRPAGRPAAADIRTRPTPSLAADRPGRRCRPGRPVGRVCASDSGPSPRQGLNSMDNPPVAVRQAAASRGLSLFPAFSAPSQADPSFRPLLHRSDSRRNRDRPGPTGPAAPGPLLASESAFLRGSCPGAGAAAA